METSKNLASEETLEKYETPPVIAAMQDFMDYIEYFLEFVSLVLEFSYLPDEARDSVLEYQTSTTDILQIYESSLNSESVEELESRQDSILSEIGLISMCLARNEMIMDQYLIFADEKPLLRPQFGFLDGIISESANC